MVHLLLVDDDQELTSLLCQYLRNEGFQVTVSNDSRAGLKLCLKNHYDMLILDIMMPELDGISFLQTLRQTSTLPVIMLTAKGDDIDKVIGLEFGADDYVAKPCLPRELSARIKAILRRVQHSQPEHIVQCGPLEIYPGKRIALYQGHPIKLTGAEFSLLWLLASQSGSIVDKAELSKQVLGKPLKPFDRSIDVHISSIRQKLGQQSGHHNWIETIRGKGYQLVTPDHHIL